MRRSPRSFALLAIVPVVLASIPSLAQEPAECGANVARVVSVDFKGPDAVPANRFVGYEVTVTVEKQDASRPATVCFVVRDQDPWYKLAWAGDDVLDTGTIHIAADRTTVTVPGCFSLLNRYGKLAGTTWTPNRDSFSDEREAEVYIEITGAAGTARSGVHRIHAQN